MRRGSTAASLLDTLLEHPVLSADDAHAGLGGSLSRIYAAVARLHDAGVVRPLTQRTRNQVWGAALVLDELDDHAGRVAAVVN